MAVVEFKTYTTIKEKALDETVQPAIIQIRRKMHTAVLQKKDILAMHIQKYGFVFKGKVYL